MRLSIALCLLVVVFCIVSSSGKRTDRKSEPKGGRKHRVHVNKYAKFSTKGKLKADKEEAAKKEKAKLDKEDHVKKIKAKEKQQIKEKKKVKEERKEDYVEESDDDEDDEDDDVDEEDKDYDDDEGSDKDVEQKDDYHAPITSEEFKGELRAHMQNKGIFYNIESINKFFKGPDFFRDADVENLLKRLNNSEMEVQSRLAANPGKQMMPFYVVEGVNPDIRTKVAQILAHRVKGLYVVNQPRISIGPVLKEESAKKAYYGLSKYIIANKVKPLLLGKPVVTERYWMDHASYIMAKLWNKAADLPQPGAEVYKFPEDLLVPNITFVIFNSPPPPLGKEASKLYKFEQRMLLVYKRFTGAKIHIIRFPESPKLIADKIDMYLHGQMYPQERHFEITLA